MRIFEITRRGFLGAIAGGAANLLIAKVHAQPGKVSQNYNLYDKKVHSFVAKAVAKLMEIPFNESAPLPDVVSFNSVDTKIFLETWGWIPTGGPASHYHWVRNLIILAPIAKIDTLAHEFVHYFQFHAQYRNQAKYAHMDRDGMYEWEAVKYQNEFVSYLESNKSNT